MRKYLPVQIILFVLLVHAIIFQPEVMGATPLNGSYTINSGGATGGANFQSFNALADTLSVNGVSGNVIITVMPGSGPYNEQVIFNTVPGAGASATVTLNGSGETITASPTTTNRHIIRFADVDYFNLTNLHVVMNAAATHCYGIHIFNTGDFITIDDCTIDLTGGTSSFFGAIVASGSDISILTTGDFHNISVIANTITGGSFGVSVFGLVSNLASNIVIDNNTFYDFSSNGVYLRETDGAVISANTFDKRTSNITGVNAIQIAQAANINAKIFNNFIQVSQTNNGTMNFKGIYLFDGTGHKVYNNVIHDIRLTSGNFTAIEIRTPATAPQISFNTISIDNTNATNGDLFGIAEELSNTNSILRNNIISISQGTSGTKAGLALGTNSALVTAFNSNYNDIWVPGGNVAMKGVLTPTFYVTLASWQVASTQDANSLNTDPAFVSLSQSQSSNSAIIDAGISVAGITQDILGTNRSNPPDLGAYEFEPTLMNELEAGVYLSSFPNPVQKELTVSLPVSNTGDYILNVFDLNGKIVMNDIVNAKPWETTFTLDTDILPPGNYFIRLATGNLNYHSKFTRVE